MTSKPEDISPLVWAHANQRLSSARDRLPVEDAAYFGSIFSLSTNQMQQLEQSFQESRARAMIAAYEEAARLADRWVGDRGEITEPTRQWPAYAVADDLAQRIRKLGADYPERGNGNSAPVTTSPAGVEGHEDRQPIPDGGTLHGQVARVQSDDLGSGSNPVPPPTYTAEDQEAFLAHSAPDMSREQVMADDDGTWPGRADGWRPEWKQQL